MKILLAEPRGFCAGVDRAIAIVERALIVHGAPIYVRHEIVHNKHVVSTLREKGSIFVNEVSEVPDGSVVVFSAHGVPKAVEEEARSRDLIIYDATCPLVTKVHAEVSKMHRGGYQIVMIGHRGHPEVEGTVGQVPSAIEVVEKPKQVWDLKVEDPEKVSYVSQTTISYDDARRVIDELKKRFPKVVEPKKADICYATQNRQDAVKALAKEVDLVLVVGSKSSSNSNRLREVAEGAGAKAYLLDDAEEIDSTWFEGVENVGITAGASAPEILVEEIVGRLRDLGADEVRTLGGTPEDVKFPLPKGLWQKDVDNAAKIPSAQISAPFGSIRMDFQDGQLSRVSLSTQPCETNLDQYGNHPAVKALQKYLSGDIAAVKGWKPSVGGTAFRQKVWKVISEIEPGETMTYGALAEKIHSGPRAVGGACGDNPLPIFVPCHRVVGKGNSGGFNHKAEDVSIKLWLLNHEKHYSGASSE